MLVMNSVAINLAADAMWKWEQTGRSDASLWNAAREHVTDYCADMPDGIAVLLLDAIRVTVRIANGFPPNDGVFPPNTE
jgi:hypothetical protein